MTFAIALPLAAERATDLASLQNPAGWSYDRRSQTLTIDVDFGAVTPNNFTSFDKLGLGTAPPLRTVFFSTTSTRDYLTVTVTDPQGGSTPGGVSGEGYGHAWAVHAKSYGFAIPTSAREHGMKGGDLPERFAPPIRVTVNVPAEQVAAYVKSLRFVIEGTLRTVGGRRVVCGTDDGDGYVVNEVTQRTATLLRTDQCLLFATLKRVAIMRTDGGPPLREWWRGDEAPVGESSGDAVIAAGTRGRAARSIGDRTSIEDLAVDPPHAGLGRER